MKFIKTADGRYINTSLIETLYISRVGDNFQVKAMLQGDDTEVLEDGWRCEIDARNRLELLALKLNGFMYTWNDQIINLSAIQKISFLQEGKEHFAAATLNDEDNQPVIYDGGATHAEVRDFILEELTGNEK